MGRAEGADADKGTPGIQQTADGIEFRRLQRLIKSHIRQNRGQALGQHAFAGSGRTDQQDVMAAGRSCFQRFFRHKLARHVRKV